MLRLHEPSQMKKNQLRSHRVIADLKGAFFKWVMKWPIFWPPRTHSLAKLSFFLNPGCLVMLIKNIFSLWGERAVKGGCYNTWWPQGCQHYGFFRRSTELRKLSIFLQIFIPTEFQNFQIFYGLWNFWFFLTFFIVIGNDHRFWPCSSWTARCRCTLSVFTVL